MLQKTNNGNEASLIGLILQNIPQEAQITGAEYEGPRIALFTKNPKFLQENSYIISDIVNTVKKRVVMRTDKSIRRPEEEVQQILSNAFPKDAEVSSIFLDPALGEAIVEAKRPQNLAVEKGFNTISLTAETGWKIKVRKAPHIPSTSIQNVYFTFKSGSSDREKFYREVGEKIFRPKLSLGSNISLLTLGGFRQVGRSSMLLTTPESKILLDCGINPGAKTSLEAYPRIDWADIEFDELEAVVISHAHLDHTGFLPTLFKYGYDGPVYCSEPTLPMMSLLLSDYVKIASIEGSSMLYDNRDIREMVKHCITLPYGLVTDVSPDVKVVLSNAGHILGSATVHLHIRDGLHNLVYSGDFKFASSMLFESTSWNYPRVETLVVESTYGSKEDIMPTREEVERTFVNTMNETLKAGGKVLIPVPAVGRAQEIMLVMDQYMRNKELVEVPIFIEGMISEATAIHVAFPEYLARDLRAKILGEDANPFVSEYFTTIDHHSNREEALREGPAIIMATAGMLEGGPVIEYFRELASSERNKIVFVSYQVQGTMGRRVLDGASQVSLMDNDGRIKVVDIRSKVERVEGFSGHSDYNQIIRYIARLRPKLRTVIVNHGERRKTENMAYVISRMFRLNTIQPDVQEAIRIH